MSARPSHGGRPRALPSWRKARRRRNAGLADAAWAFVLALLNPGYAWLGGGPAERRWLALVRGGLWAARLGTYLTLNRVVGTPEDGRHQELRRGWGDRADAKFLAVYQLQATWATLFAMPLLAAATSPAPFGLLDALGALEYCCCFNPTGREDWMAAHLFREGLRPSADLLHLFRDDLAVEAEWRVGGEHYRLRKTP